MGLEPTPTPLRGNATSHTLTALQLHEGYRSHRGVYAATGQQVQTCSRAATLFQTLFRTNTANGKQPSLGPTPTEPDSDLTSSQLI